MLRHAQHEGGILRLPKDAARSQTLRKKRACAAIWAILLAVGVALATPGAASAERIPVDVELVLAVDISGSIDEEEALLQRRGYAVALTDPQIVEAIQSGITGRVALAYVEWAGIRTQRVVVDWTVVSDMASARDFVARFLETPYRSAQWTSISGVIDFVVPMFADSPYEGTRRVIDISGDGANNSGRLVTLARDAAIEAGITINGLPIINDRPSRWGRMTQLPNLDWYFEDCVVGGPGHFSIPAYGFDDFARAVRRKLLLEIAGLQPDPAERWASHHRLLPASTTQRPACDAGERRMELMLQEMH